LNKALAQNISISIGRLALIDPKAVGNQLENFIKAWSISMKSVGNSEEKHLTYK